MSILAILGPTGSGKSAVALEIALRRRSNGLAPVEVVAVDAFTVYRGMDIGTAKPAPSDRSQIPHHLVDVLDPSEELTVAWFQRQARDAIAAVRERGAIPLLVGGSGLYWRAVVDRLRFPPTDAQVRTAIEDSWRDDPVAAHAHLTEIDPDAAARIDATNLRRTVRALEVHALTGQRFSSYATSWDEHRSIYGDLEVGYLEPDPERLRERIRRRAEDMVAAGLLDEAARLRAGPPLSRTAAQAIGYAEAFDVLDGSLEAGELAAAIATRTWRYAKRQRGWFRADPRCVPTDPEQLVARWSAAS